MTKRIVEAEGDLVACPRLARYRFHMRALEPIALPPYTGSAWRGLLGQGLRRVLCVTRQPTCQGCMLAQTCLYSTFFESPATASVEPRRRYDKLPHPFVLEPEVSSRREIGEGAPLSLGITLMGSCVEHVPYVIHALSLAGEGGLGRRGGRFSLVGVERQCRIGAPEWEPVYSKETGEYRNLETADSVLPQAPAAVRVHFLTPLRIKSRGHLVGSRDFRTETFLRHLCARLALLAELYGGDPEPFAWRRLATEADGIRQIDADLRWHEWTRFSSRQNTLMQMGGLLGSLVLEGPALSSFWPALWQGQWFHVGKGTSFGLGGYRLDQV